jgi:hypothetical protein
MYIEINSKDEFVYIALLTVGWGGIDRIDLAQDREQWRALVNMVMSLLKCWEILE